MRTSRRLKARLRTSTGEPQGVQNRNMTVRMKSARKPLGSCWSEHRLCGVGHWGCVTGDGSEGAVSDAGRGKDGGVIASLHARSVLAATYSDDLPISGNRIETYGLMRV